MKHYSRFHRSLAVLSAVVVFSGLSILCTNQAFASITIYNFVDEDTGDILAVLDLSSLPASPAEINSLTFTMAGDAIFGYGVGVYTGSFVAPDGDSVIAEGTNGLMGDGVGDFAYFSDLSAPVSSIYGVATTLDMGFASGDNLDYLNLFVAEGEGEFYEFTGSWELAVPEPTTLLIWSSLSLTSLIARRRRRRS